MDEKRKEIRSVDCQLSVREADGNAQGEPSRTVVGRAIVFDAESEVLDEWGYKFREVIKPEAVTMEFLNTQDVKMNMLHDRQLTLARCNKGTGSLRLTVDERGVGFEFDAPKCDIGDRCLEMVRRGDYSGCSFEFYPEEYDIEERDGDKDVKIIHRKLRALPALTIGMDPAYTQTEVNARELAGRCGADDSRTADTERDGSERERMERECRRRKIETEIAETDNFINF